MTERTFVELYALQTDETTRIMAVVGGEEEVCLFSYPRKYVRMGSVTAIEMVAADVQQR